MKRAVNVGFSGGEKKRNEMVQMGIIDPRLAVLDETDSGLDIDALRVVGDGINRIMRKPDKAVLLITHYQRLLDMVEPDFVHVLAGGRIVRSGGPELAHQLEREGYARAEGGVTLLALPSNREEGWRWSDLSALPGAGRARGRPAASPDDLPWLDCAHEGPRLLFVDGKLDAAPQPARPDRDRPGRGRVATGHPLAPPGRPQGWTLRLGRDHAPPGSSRSSTSRPAPPTISPRRSRSTTTPRPRSSRPSSATAGPTG